MCVVSNIGDAFTKRAPDLYPWATPASPSAPPVVTRAEFEALRHEMRELKLLLTAAKRYDAATGQTDCEMDEKVALIKRMAEIVGVDMTEVFEKGNLDG